MDQLQKIELNPGKDTACVKNANKLHQILSPKKFCFICLFLSTKIDNFFNYYPQHTAP